MKTKIVNYGMDNELFGLGLASYDEHDSETGQGVYGREDMMRFVHVVTDHFLTPRQKYFYFQCVVYGKKVEDIAALEGVDDSTVYKHLKLAKQKIASVKELMRIADGKKGTIVLFQQFISGIGKKAQIVAEDYYLKGLSYFQIAKKNNLYLSDVNGILAYIRNNAIYKGLSIDDLKLIRNYYKKQRSVSNGFNSN